MTEKTKSLYIIETEQGQRLVAAKSITGAIAHVVKDLLVARKATPLDVASLMSSGVRVEDANAEPEAEVEAEQQPLRVAA